MGKSEIRKVHNLSSHVHHVRHNVILKCEDGTRTFMLEWVEVWKYSKKLLGTSKRALLNISWQNW